MKPFRSRSYNLSNKRKKESCASAAEESVHSAEESSIEERLGQSFSDTSLGVGDGRLQESSAGATLLVHKKLDDEGEEITDAFLDSDVSAEKVQSNSSEDSESDYSMSEKVSEDGNDNTLNATEKSMTEIQGDLEDHQEESDSDSEGADEKESVSEDNSTNIPTPDVKKCLDLDQLELGDSYTERQIYETQLVQLQRQLVETIIREQEASEKLKKLEDLNLDVLLEQLETEKAKTSELEDKLEFMKNKEKNSQLKRSNASRRIKRRSRNLETVVNQKESALGEATEDTTKADNQQEKTSGYAAQPDDDDDDDKMVFNFDEEHFAVPPESTKDEEKTVISSIFAFLQEYKKIIVETVFDRAWDFVNDDQEGSKKKDDDELSVIKLRENINRCKSGAQPITRILQPVIDVLTWGSPVASFMTFWVYMIAIIQGFLLPLIILMAILQLASNYFYASGLADRLGFKWKEEPSPPDDKKLTDKFLLVLQVAKKVQNALGEVADSLEKIKNLLNWRHPATKKLFHVLCLAFVASSILDGSVIFRIVGIAAGIKFFIIRPIYTKFPKVKKRYDNLARLWNELPTDADLAKQKKKEFYFSAAVTDEDDAPASPKSPKLMSPQYVTRWTNFCLRMKIPLTETPVPSWEEGHRCTLMTRDIPLTKMKQGKLFLSQNYLCFERYKFGTPKHVVIKLEDIVDAEKYKPINIMPGTGTSIKIEIRGSFTPYIFGGLVIRDELFESLIATCKTAQAPLVCEGKY